MSIILTPVQGERHLIIENRRIQGQKWRLYAFPKCLLLKETVTDFSSALDRMPRNIRSPSNGMKITTKSPTPGQTKGRSPSPSSTGCGHQRKMTR